MNRVSQLIVCAFLILILTGCGAGGGGGKSGDSINPTPTNPSAYTLQIPANQPVTQPAGDVNISVPVGTFPQGSELTITFQPTTEKPTTDFEVISDLPVLNLSSSATPQGPITITPTNRIISKDDNYLYFFTRKINGEWDTLNDLGVQAINSLDFIVDKTKFGFNGAKSEIQGLIGRIKIISITDVTDMTLMINDPLAPPNTVLVLVHGFNSNVEAMRFAANQIQVAHRYSKIYSIAYDWRRGGQSVATDLGNYLDGFHNQGQHVDILAHSWGVLISRYALEVLGKTETVANLYAVCGPNEGTALASLTELIRFLRKDYLNKPGSDQPFGLAALDTPAASEMIPSSGFLNLLNHREITQRGLVHYSLFASYRDAIVPVSSALAQNSTLDSYTMGTIETFRFNYDHSGLVSTTSGVSDLLSIISRRKNTYIQVDASPQYVDAASDGWYYTIEILNLGTDTIQTKDLTMERYDRYGNWQGVCWYNPSTPFGEFFPNQYQLWQRNIAPGETIRIPCQSWPDIEKHSIIEAADCNKAKTLYLNLKYRDNSTGMQMITSGLAYLHFGDIWPDQAHTRNYAKNVEFGISIGPGNK